MINYSVVLRGVNKNLFEINQAKARIRNAKTTGQSPETSDVQLVKTEVTNAFAVAQYSEVMTIEKFARHIASHGSVYHRADIAAILYLAVDCMREQLLAGKKVRLGELGDFYVTLNSRGAETADKFSAENITSVNVQWDCGGEFKNLINEAEFNLVASRAAQAAVIKAIKAGKSSVELGSPAAGDDAAGDAGNESDASSGNNPGGESKPPVVTPEPGGEGENGYE